MSRIAIAVCALVLLVACGKQRGSVSLSEGVWVAALPQEDPERQTAYTVQFGEDGKWTARGRCSRSEGIYTTQTDSLPRIAISMETLHQEDCPESAEDQLFFQQLRMAESYVMERDSLVLVSGPEAETESLTFIRHK